MKQCSCLQALQAIPEYLQLYTENCTDFRELGPIVLSAMSVFSFAKDRPMDAATWQDWKESIQKILEKNLAFEPQKNEVFNPDITWEQGFIATCSFLDEYYWEKNNKISVDEAVADLTKNLVLSPEFFNSVLWKTWVETVQKSLEYNFEYE